MPTNLLGLLQAILTLVMSNPDLIPTIIRQMQVALDALITLFAGKNLSNEQIASIDAAYDHIMGVAEELEVKILGISPAPSPNSHPEDGLDNGGQ